MKNSIQTLALLAASLSILSPSVRADDLAEIAELSARAKCDLKLSLKTSIVNYEEIDTVKLVMDLQKRLAKKDYRMVNERETHSLSVEITAKGSKKRGDIDVALIYAATDGSIRLTRTVGRSGQKRKKQIKAMENAVDEAMDSLPECTR